MCIHTEIISALSIMSIYIEKISTLSMIMSIYIEKISTLSMIIYI